jgi:hypothetical protein
MHSPRSILLAAWLVNFLAGASEQEGRSLTNSYRVAGADAASSYSESEIRENYAKKPPRDRATSFSFNNTKDLRDLLVGGEDVRPRDYQYFGFSSYDELNPAVPSGLCGGSLIHPDIFMTAAHCQGAFIYGVNLYDPDTRDFTREVQIVSQHRFPDYNLNNGNINFDILVRRTLPCLAPKLLVRKKSNCF